MHFSLYYCNSVYSLRFLFLRVQQFTYTTIRHTDTHLYSLTIIRYARSRDTEQTLSTGAASDIWHFARFVSRHLKTSVLQRRMRWRSNHER